MQAKIRLLAALSIIASFLAVSSSNAAATASYVITTFAGTGTGGYSGDGGAATSAQVGSPNLVNFDSSGNLYIADAWGRVRKVTTGGIISTFAGTGTNSFSGDGGAATSAQVNSPGGTVADSSGNVYIADYNNNRVRKVTPGGIISTIAGTGTGGSSGDGGAATSALLTNPAAVGLDSSGNLYIADYGNNRIRKVTTGGIISTVVGTGSGGFSGDGASATSAQISFPNSIAFDTTGNMYFADYGNNRIRMVNTSGNISTVAGNGSTTFAGDGGAATSATLDHPQSATIDTAGNLWIADTNHNRIRKVDTGGTITTIAGTGTASSTGDGGDATAATMNSPVGVAFDTNGNLYVSESSGARVRKIANIAPASGTTTVSAVIDPFFTLTVAGRATACNSQAPGTFSTSATSSAVSMGHLSGSSSVGGAQDISIATNAVNGAVVNIRAPSAPNALNDGAGHSIADVSGTHASPGTAPAAGTPAFGYTTNDASIAFGSNTFAKVTTVDGSVLSASAGTTSKSVCVGYQASASTTTRAGSYSATIIYTAVPAF